MKAIREIVINAFAHANYSLSGDHVQIVLHKSSIRIYNPGSIYKNINPMKFAKAEVGSKIRNVLIASVLYKCGFIDVFGTGFDRIFTLCIQNDIDYEYHNDEFGFTFIFKRNLDFLNDKVNDKVNNIDKLILQEIRKNKHEVSFLHIKTYICNKYFFRRNSLILENVNNHFKIARVSRYCQQKRCRS